MCGKANTFEKARQTYLPGFIRGRKIKLSPQGSSFGSNFCPRCGKAEHEDSNKVSVFLADGTWRWKCFSCALPAASAIDYAAALWDCTDREAAERLANTTIITPPAEQKQRVQRTERTPEVEAAVTEALGKIFRASGVEVGAQYLMSRGIPKSIVDEAGKRGIFRSFHDNPGMAQRFLEATCGIRLLEKSGLKKEGNRWCAVAFRPVIFPLGRDGAEFRLNHEPKEGELKAIRYGRLSLPSYWKVEGSKDVLVVEGAIDMLSCVGMEWQGNVMGIPGVSSYRMEWFAEIKKRNPNAMFHLGLDPDKAGFEATMKMSELLEHGNFPHKIIGRGQSMLDWNDELKSGSKF